MVRITQFTAQCEARSVDHVKTARSVGIALTSLIPILSHFHVAIPIQITVPVRELHHVHPTEFTSENGKPEFTFPSLAAAI